MNHSTPPLITAPRARKLLALLNEQLLDQDDALNEATDAHLTKDEKAFYRAMTDARCSRAFVTRALTLLAQGQFEEAEKQFVGLSWKD